MIISFISQRRLRRQYVYSQKVKLMQRCHYEILKVMCPLCEGILTWEWNVNSNSYVTFQDPGKKYVWPSLSRLYYTTGMSSITLCCNKLLEKVIAFKKCCSHNTAHAHLLWILFPNSKNPKESQKCFKLNIGPCTGLIISTSSPFPRAQKSFIFVVYICSCGIFSCYLISSTFMWYAYASGAECSGGGCLRLGAKL